MNDFRFALRELIWDLRFAICNWARVEQRSLLRYALSLTHRFSGVYEPTKTRNRFRGFEHNRKTAEAVRRLQQHDSTLLKQGVNENCVRKVPMIKQPFVLLGLLLLLPPLADAAEYNLGELAKSHKLEVFNRGFTETKAESAEAIFLNAAPGDGVAWITGVEFSEGTIDVEIKGRNEQGRSFVGIAFHGLDDRAFDAVYFRPFNFQSAEQERRGHSIQYISLPEYDWKRLRDDHPGKYEFTITPPPDPDSWVKLKVVITGKKVTAFVNGSDKPVLTVELLNNRLKGKLGLWVGNGSDGGFRNLKVIPASK